MTFDVSKQVIKGDWVLLASNNNIATAVTESFETTDGTAISREVSRSFSGSIESGYELDIGFADFGTISTGYSIEGSEARATAESVETTVIRST